MANDQDASADRRTLIAVIVLAVFGILGICAIVFCVWRMKLRRANTTGLPVEEGGSGYVFTGFGTKKGYQGERVEGSHPATKIMPFAFAANGEGPVYDHVPGDNMRIASRMNNGIWAFHDVDPATGSPLGVNDPIPSPSTPFASSASSTFSFEPRGYNRSDAASTRTTATSQKSLGNYFDLPESFGFTPPPATYGSHSPGLPPPTSRQLPPRIDTVTLPTTRRAS